MPRCEHGLVARAVCFLTFLEPLAGQPDSGPYRQIGRSPQGRTPGTNQVTGRPRVCS
jgi:hypothetical protein